MTSAVAMSSQAVSPLSMGAASAAAAAPGSAARSAAAPRPPKSRRPAARIWSIASHVRPGPVRDRPLVGRSVRRPPAGHTRRRRCRVDSVGSRSVAVRCRGQPAGPSACVPAALVRGARKTGRVAWRASSAPVDLRSAHVHEAPVRYPMRSIGVLIVSLVVGGLLAGHGAQKLFGWFGGPGLQGTTGWLESLRMRPATVWARMAGGSELAGGLLTMLGFLNPLGPIAGIGAMGMAWAKVHLGKPVWVTTGGAELPLTNIAVLTALSIAGPGKLSLDSLLGIRIPRLVGLAALLGTLGAIWYGARPELEAGTTDIAAAGAQVEGDPSASSEDRADIATAGAAGGEGVGIDSLDVASYEDTTFTGLHGSDAGTSMGSGSELGSETAVDSF